MNYLSVCSGIEAATVAWRPMGWEAVAYAEIERFPRAVLQYHYPETPLFGDFTSPEFFDYAGKQSVDVLVGGTPCQGFSIAGLRKGLDDDRSNLALQFLKLADAIRPTWICWENVPGVFSTNDGRDFGAFLGGLEELGYGFAWRIFDAQYFGVPQRRRRIFLVGHSGGDWRPPFAVLLERESLQGNLTPRREAGEGVAPTIRAGANRTGGDRPPGTDVDTCESLVTPWDYQRLRIHDARGLAPSLSQSDEGGGCRTLTIAFTQNQVGDLLTGHVTPSMGCNGNATGRNTPKVFTQNTRDEVRYNGGDIPGALPAQSGAKQQAYLHLHPIIRRLTPLECERLMGFPDEYTKIPYRGKSAEQCPDGPRYAALGNSMVVQVMAYIGKRIQMCSEVMEAAYPESQHAGD